MSWGVLEGSWALLEASLGVYAASWSVLEAFLDCLVLSSRCPLHPVWSPLPFRGAFVGTRRGGRISSFGYLGGAYGGGHFHTARAPQGVGGLLRPCEGEAVEGEVFFNLGLSWAPPCPPWSD